MDNTKNRLELLKAQLGTEPEPTKDLMPNNLTDKQARFIEEYLVDLNATQAAIRAGYSQDTARSIGCENLAKPDIQEAIAIRQKQIRESLDLRREFIIAEAYEQIRLAKNEGDRQTVFKFLDMFNKMMGNYSTTVNNNVTVVPPVFNIDPGYDDYGD